MKLSEEEKASYMSLCSMAKAGEKDPKDTPFVSTRRGVLGLEMTQAKPSTIKFQFEYETVESKPL